MFRRQGLIRLAAGVLAVVAGSMPSAAMARQITVYTGMDLPGAPLSYIREFTDFFLPESIKRVAAETQHTLRFEPAPSDAAPVHARIVTEVRDSMPYLAVWCACTQDAKLLPWRFDAIVPFSSPDVSLQLKVKRRILAENPEVLMSLENRFGQTVMAMTATGDRGLATRRAWDRTENLNGVAIVADDLIGRWVAAVGGDPAFGALPSVKSLITGGKASGVAVSPVALNGLRIFEAAPFFKQAGFGAPVENVMTMTAKVRRVMPHDVLRVMDDVAQEYQERVNIAAIDDARRAMDALRRAGVTVSDLDDTQRRVWAEAAQNGVNGLANDLIADYGVDGIGILSKYVKYSEEAGYRWPIHYEFRRLD